MNRILYPVVCFCLFPGVAGAQAMGGYLEGNLGAAFISDVDAHIDVPDLSATITGDYGTEFLFGLEAGISGLGNAGNLRLGLSWDHVKAELDSVRVSGTKLSGPFSFSGSCPDSDGFCSDVDEKINVIAANAYIDFGIGNDMGIQPFIGAGAGLAFFEGADSQFAASGTVGARIPLGTNAYIGGRYRLQWISGTSDGFVTYDNITVHGVSALVGVNF